MTRTPMVVYAALITFCLLASSAMAKEYVVTVTTGDMFLAGTDADVFITIHGATAASAELDLDNGENNFEKGKTDVFKKELADLGALKKVRIRHNNAKPAPGWFLKGIVIKDVATGIEYKFPCDKWLADDKDDKKIDRDIDVVP